MALGTRRSALGAVRRRRNARRAKRRPALARCAASCSSSSRPSARCSRSSARARRAGTRRTPRRATFATSCARRRPSAAPFFFGLVLGRPIGGKGTQRRAPGQVPSAATRSAVRRGASAYVRADVHADAHTRHSHARGICAHRSRSGHRRSGQHGAQGKQFWHISYGILVMAY